MTKKVVIVGSGNAAMSAGIAALEAGADVLMLEKASEELAGGNTKYTAGAMRFSYESSEELIPLLTDLMTSVSAGQILAVIHNRNSQMICEALMKAGRYLLSRNIDFTII